MGFHGSRAPRFRLFSSQDLPPRVYELLLGKIDHLGLGKDKYSVITGVDVPV